MYMSNEKHQEIFYKQQKHFYTFTFTLYDQLD